MGLVEVDNTNYADVITTGSIPWRHLETSWTIDRRMIAMNLDPARIVEIFLTQREQAIISLAEYFEATSFWNKPSTSSDNKEMFGIFYWLSYSATQGFNGGNPTGFTAGRGGLCSG